MLIATLKQGVVISAPHVGTRIIVRGPRQQALEVVEGARVRDECHHISEGVVLGVREAVPSPKVGLGEANANEADDHELRLEAINSSIEDHGQEVVVIGEAGVVSLEDHVLGCDVNADGVGAEVVRFHCRASIETAVQIRLQAVYRLTTRQIVH